MQFVSNPNPNPDPEPNPNPLTLTLTLTLILTLTGAVPVVIGVVGLFVVISAISLLRFLLSTRIYQFKRIGAAARLITRAVVRLGPSKVKLAVTFCELFTV